jgi:hypothetical protein
MTKLPHKFGQSLRKTSSKEPSERITQKPPINTQTTTPEQGDASQTHSAEVGDDIFTQESGATRNVLIGEGAHWSVGSTSEVTSLHRVLDALGSLSPVQVKTKTKRLAGVLGTIASASRVVKTPNIDLQKKAEEYVRSQKENKINYLEQIADSGGVQEVLSSGILTVPAEFLSVFKLNTVDEANSVAVSRNLELSKIRTSDVTVLKMQELEEYGVLHDFVRLCSVPNMVYVYIESKDGNVLEKPGKVNRIKKVSMFLADGKEKNVSKHNTMRVSMSSVMALKCLQEGDLEMFKKIIAVSPHQALFDICYLPIRGEVLSRRSLLDVFRVLTSRDGNDIYSDPISRQQSEVMGLAIRCYLGQKNFRADEQSPLKILVRLKRKDRLEADKLLLHTALFMQEVKLLIRGLMFVGPSHSNESSDSGAETMQGETDSRIAWQVAHVIGHAFVYATSAVAEIKADEKSVEKATALIFSAGIAAGTEGATTVVPQAVVEPLKALAEPLVELVATRVSDSGQTASYEMLADHLGYLSDAIISRSSSGLLNPGSEITAEEFSRLTKEEKRIRTEIGENFSRIYRKNLKSFKEHSLRRHLKDAAKGLV